MATGVTSAKLFANHKIEMFDHDPGTTDAVVVSSDGGTTPRWVAMRDYQEFGLVCMTSVSASSSGPSLVEIVAATDSSGTNITAVLTSGTVDADALGDYVAIEVTDEQIREVGSTAGFNFTHVAGRITSSNAGDECVVTYIRGDSKRPQAGLTATTIA